MTVRLDVDGKVYGQFVPLGRDMKPGPILSRAPEPEPIDGVQTVKLPRLPGVEFEVWTELERGWGTQFVMRLTVATGSSVVVRVQPKSWREPPQLAWDRAYAAALLTLARVAHEDS